MSTLFDQPHLCQSRHFGPPCGAEATCTVSVGLSAPKPHCDRCAEAVVAWADSPGMSARWHREAL